jgi:hypothetical protein
MSITINVAPQQSDADFGPSNRQGIHLTRTLGHLCLKSPVDKGLWANKKAAQ